MIRTRNGSPRTSSAGFSLIEVLVSLAILSVALLGQAGLQVMSLRSTTDSVIRKDAAMVATEILDRMRVNRTAALGGLYNIGLGQVPTVTGVPLQDLQYWQDVMVKMRAGSQGSIVVQNGIATIAIQWSSADGEASTFRLRSQL